MKQLTPLLLLAIMLLSGSNALAQSSKDYEPSAAYKYYNLMKNNYCTEMANLDCPLLDDKYYKYFTRGNKSMTAFIDECTENDWRGVCKKKCLYYKECRANDKKEQICFNECQAELKTLYENTPEFAKVKEEERKKEEEYQARMAEQKRQNEIARIQKAESAASALRRQQEIQTAELEEKRKNYEKAKLQQEAIAKANLEHQQKKLILEAKQEIDRLIQINDVTSQNECTCICLNSNATRPKIRELASVYNGTYSYTSNLDFLHDCKTKGRVFGFSSKQVDQIFNAYRESEQTHFLLCESICAEAMPKAAPKTSIKDMISNTLR